jgi:tripartite-type tricarboxylate transporter receptor subunit TctC
MYAPAKTPQATVNRLSALIAKSLQTPDLHTRLIQLGYEPTGTTPEQLAAIMAADSAHWGPIIRASGFRADE